MRTWTGRALAAAALVAAVSCTADGAGPAAQPAAGPRAPAAGTAAPAPGRTSAGPGELLLPAEHGDGDSWRDTRGRTYRLGLVNAPEQDECFGRQATEERKALVADGFRAEVYAQDRYGRGVSVVTTADGRVVNVHLARHGFADDRYLEQFRQQHPELAARLDEAFAAARAERRGLWAACAPEQAPGRCHPDYATCVPVQGDGSGRGGTNDLDCGQLRGTVRLRQAGIDAYRLDSDGDGLACGG